MKRVLAVAAAAVLASSVAPPTFAAADDQPTGQCAPPAKTVIPQESWAQQRVAADRVWPLTTGSGVVAVIDTGVAAGAQGLSGAVLPGTDLRGGKGDGDCFGRGTFIAGLIAARPGTGPFVGVAPGARIYPVRVSDDPPKILDHAGLSRDIAQGIKSAVDGGATVVAVGILATIGTPELQQAVEYAAAKDAVVIAPAVVPKQGQLAFPARLPGVVSVAPLTPSGPVTNQPYGADPMVAAPAGDLVSVAPEGAGTRLGSGTELAVGYVAGTAALIRTYYPSLSAAQVRDRLLRTADHPSAKLPDKYVGYGAIDPYAAVSTVLDNDAPVRPAAEQLPITLPKERDPEPGNRAMMFAGIAGAAALLIAGPAVIVAAEKKKRKSRQST